MASATIPASSESLSEEECEKLAQDLAITWSRIPYWQMSDLCHVPQRCLVIQYHRPDKDLVYKAKAMRKENKEIWMHRDAHRSFVFFTKQADFYAEGSTLGVKPIEHVQDIIRPVRREEDRDSFAYIVLISIPKSVNVKGSSDTKIGYVTKSIKSMSLRSIPVLDVERSQRAICEYLEQCHVCQKTNDLKRCSFCMVTSYCSKRCQATHWRFHRIVECEEMRTHFNRVRMASYMS